MEYLLTAAEMAEADRATSEEIGIPSLVLMERAALGVAGAVRADFPSPGAPHTRVAVVAGKGNNGADAVAAGRMLLDEGYEVRFFMVSRGGSIPSAFFGTGMAAQLRVDYPMHGPLPSSDNASWHIDAGRERAPLQQTAQPAPNEKTESAMDTQLHILRSYGAMVSAFSQEEFVSFRPDIILDGLFGTGLSRDVAEPFSSAIRLINQAREALGSRVYSVDIPSGVDGTTGRIMGSSVQADVTVTFAFYKRGHFLYPGCERCGRLILHKIGITKRSLGTEPGMFTYQEESASDLLPARSSAGNKGTFGKVLVIAGSRGVGGACTMCAQTVLRSGAGMVKVYTHEDNRIILQETVPEAMCRTYGAAGSDAVTPGDSISFGYGAADTDSTSDGMRKGQAFERLQESEAADLLQDLAWADVAAIGPGIGRDERAKDILVNVLDYAASQDSVAVNHAASRAHTGMEVSGGRTAAAGRRFALVIDADAIRLIAQYNLYEKLRAAGRAARLILTPHMAECAALFHMSIQDLQVQRLKRSREFADLYSCTLCLKDARTLISSSDSAQQYLNTSGNDGLSTAGSGDVLTGLTAACLAQGMDAFPAACAASYLHGRAAERLTSDEMSRRSLMATDLIRVLAE